MDQSVADGDATRIEGEDVTTVNGVVVNNGGGAWQIKNKWDKKFIKKFQNQLTKKLAELNSTDKKFTCDDLNRMSDADSLSTLTKKKKAAAVVAIAAAALAIQQNKRHVDKF